MQTRLIADWQPDRPSFSASGDRQLVDQGMPALRVLVACEKRTDLRPEQRKGPGQIDQGPCTSRRDLRAADRRVAYRAAVICREDVGDLGAKGGQRNDRGDRDEHDDSAYSTRPWPSSSRSSCRQPGHRESKEALQFSSLHTNERKVLIIHVSRSLLPGVPSRPRHVRFTRRSRGKTRPRLIDRRTELSMRLLSPQRPRNSDRPRAGALLHGAGRPALITRSVRILETQQHRP